MSRVVIGVDRAPVPDRAGRLPASLTAPRHGGPAVALHAAPTIGVRLFRISLAAFVALSVARVHETIPALAHIPLGKPLVPIMLAAIVVALPRWQLLAALRTTTAKCVAVIAVLALLSIPLAIWPSNSIAFVINVLTPLIALFLIVSTGFADRATARVGILSLVLAVIAGAGYVLLGVSLDAEGRAFIGGLDPNDSAALFVSTIPFATLLASQRGSKRYVGFVAVGLLVAAIVKTGSRGGVIGLLVVALLLILRAGPRKRWAYVIGIVIGAAVFALAADETRLTRFETILTPQSDYNFTEREGRIPVWSRGIGYMLTHPFLGVGIQNFETAEGVLSGKKNEGYGIRYTAAHNSFVQIGAELGVFGLAAFVLSLWSAGRDCRRIHKSATRDLASEPQLAEEEARLAAAAYCALVGLSVTGFFLSFAYHPVTYFFLAVCVGVRAGSPYGTPDLTMGTATHRVRSTSRDPNAAFAGRSTAWRSRVVSSRHVAPNGQDALQ